LPFSPRKLGRYPHLGIPCAFSEWRYDDAVRALRAPARPLDKDRADGLLQRTYEVAQITRARGGLWHPFRDRRGDDGHLALGNHADAQGTGPHSLRGNPLDQERGAMRRVPKAQRERDVAVATLLADRAGLSDRVSHRVGNTEG